MSFVIQISWTCPCIVHTNFTVCPSNCLCSSTVFSDVFGCILYQKHNNEVIAKQFRFRNIQIVKMNGFFLIIFAQQISFGHSNLKLRNSIKCARLLSSEISDVTITSTVICFEWKKKKNLLSATHWSFSPTRAFFVWHILSIAL